MRVIGDQRELWANYILGKAEGILRLSSLRTVHITVQTELQSEYSLKS